MFRNNFARVSRKFNFDAGGRLDQFYDVDDVRPWWDAQYRYDVAGRVDATRPISMRDPSDTKP